MINGIDYTSNPILKNNALRMVMTPTDLTYDNVHEAVNFIPEDRFEVRDMDRVPLVTRHKRLATPDDVEALQMAYREMAMNCLKTTYSSRINLINTPHITRNGVPVYKIQGVVVDPRFDVEGQLLRVWLMNPAVIDPDDPTNVIPVDTHLWLMMPRMTMKAPEDGEKITSTSGLDGDQLTVTLGDMITVECTLMGYEASTGRGGKRIGIESWRPIDSKMVYFTRGHREQVAPRNIKGRLRLFALDSYGVLNSVNEWDWEDELDDAKSRRPKEGSGFYRFEEVASRMEAQAAMSYFADRRRKMNDHRK